jgi:ferredoxin
VYAEDLPRYLAAGQRKDDAMRHVRFGVRERLEMAAAWAAPTALVLGPLALWLRPAWSAPLVVLTVGLATSLFLFYDRLPEPRRWLFGGAAVALAVGVTALAGGGVAALLAGAAASAGLTGLLTFDYSGSTPVEGGSHFEEKAWHVVLDVERCRGVYNCWAVCPEACFEKRDDARVVALAHDDRCIRCGACIVQCPLDALAFENQVGERIEPDTIRTYKLNLLGERKVAGEVPGDATAAGTPETSPGEPARDRPMMDP